MCIYIYIYYCIYIYIYIYIHTHVFTGKNDNHISAKLLHGFYGRHLILPMAVPRRRRCSPMTQTSRLKPSVQTTYHN